MTSKKGNRVPWSGHWEVAGAGMGVVTGAAGAVKSLQNPEEDELVLEHDPPKEALNRIVEAQKVADDQLIQTGKTDKSPAFWRGPRQK